MPQGQGVLLDLSTVELRLPCTRQLVASTTATFQRCSGQVRLLEEQLSESAYQPDLASLLRGVQILERQKLQLTLDLQVCCFWQT